MKTMFILVSVLTLSFSATAFASMEDIDSQNIAPVTEFASSGEHVGEHYCKTCGKYVPDGNFNDGPLITPVGAPIAAPVKGSGKGGSVD